MRIRRSATAARVGHRTLPVQLGEAPDRRERRAQLVAGVGDEPPHALLGAAGAGLGAGLGPEGPLDLLEHGVERPAEPAHLGAGVVVGHAAGQVAAADGRRGHLDLAEGPQRRPHHRHAHEGQAGEDRQPDEDVDLDQAVTVASTSSRLVATPRCPRCRPSARVRHGEPATCPSPSTESTVNGSSPRSSASS